MVYFLYKIIFRALLRLQVRGTLGILILFRTPDCFQVVDQHHAIHGQNV